MGFTIRRKLCESFISFERACGYTEEDLPNFRGTIICRPSNDTPRQEIPDWEALDDDYEGSLDEAREW